METLEIKGQADQEPFARNGCVAAQRERAEAKHLRDDADHRFDRPLTRAVHRCADRRFELVRHPHLSAGVFGRWVGLRREALPPTLVMGLTAGRDVGFDVPVGALSWLVGSSALQPRTIGARDIGADIAWGRSMG